MNSCSSLFRKMKPEELKHYAANIGDPLLEEFMRAFSSKEGFGRERIHNAVSKVSEAVQFYSKSDLR